MNDKVGYIYILKNPSFPDYIKIGYADDVYSRLKQLNDKSAVPFAFRLYAYYKVDHRLEDKAVHDIIDKLNPSLRAKDTIDGKVRKREFFQMTAEDAYDLLHNIAKIHGDENNLILVEPTSEELKDEEDATTKGKTSLPKMDWLIDQGIINIGDEVYLINHPEEIATIEDGKNVKYKDQVMSFNQFGCELTGWKAIQIYAFMKKVGGDKTLAKLREEKMKELGMLE